MLFNRVAFGKDFFEVYKQVHKEQTGSEISDVRIEVNYDSVVLTGEIVLTSEEKRYMTSRAGQKLICQVRTGLLEEAKPVINAKLSSFTGYTVCESFIEINLEKRLLQHTFIFRDAYDNAI